jgi:hypothetical protein
MITLDINRLVDWIMDHRFGNAFRGYSKETIVQEIVEGSMNGTLMYYLDEDDQIVGVAVGRRDDRKRNIHVYDVLTTMPGILKIFIVEFTRRYPQYSVTGSRRNGRRLVIEDMQKLLRKL